MRLDYKFDELLNKVKKNYVDTLGNDVIDMQKEIERLRGAVRELKAQNETLNKTLEDYKFKVENDPSYTLGKAVAKYVKDTIKTDVMDNLSVEVDADYDPYSGRPDHEHKTEIFWNEFLDQKDE